MTKKAVFAGGCFGCMVKPFEEQPGIISVTSGYTGGHVPNPTYEQVTTGTTGHTEAVEIEYDPEVISYDQLVEIYWQQKPGVFHSFFVIHARKAAFHAGLLAHFPRSAIIVSIESPYFFNIQRRFLYALLS